MTDKFLDLLNIIVGIFFFIFYVTIMNVFLHLDAFSFPYIILTIYFFISIFTLGPVNTALGEKTKDWNSIIASYTTIVAYLISPVWILVNFVRTKGD